jgi:uncharacterized membrane protein
MDEENKEVVENAEESTQQVATDSTEAIDAAKDNATKLAGAAKDKVAEVAGLSTNEKKDLAKDTVAQAKDKGTELAGQAKDKASDLADAAKAKKDELAALSTEEKKELAKDKANQAKEATVAAAAAASAKGKEQVANFKNAKFTVDEKVKVKNNYDIELFRAEIKDEAQKRLSGKWGSWAKTLLVYLVVIGIISLIVTFIQGNILQRTMSFTSYGYNGPGFNHPPVTAGSFFLKLIRFILYLVLLVIGIVIRPLFMFLAVDTIEGKKLNARKTAEKLFKNELGRVVWANVVVAVFTFLWSLLLVIPGIIKGASYAMTNFLLKKHPELTAFEAIHLSKKMMYGYKFEYIIFELSYFWWYLVTAITNGLAGAYVIPYTNVGKALFFEKVYNAKKVD